MLDTGAIRHRIAAFITPDFEIAIHFRNRLAIETGEDKHTALKGIGARQSR